MRKLLLILFAFSSFTVEAQTLSGRMLIDSFQTSAVGRSYGLTWLPQTYNTSPLTKRYPLIVFAHGAGEGGNTKAHLSRIYANQPGTPPGLIANGWNATAVNPLTSVRDSFIVISVQYNGQWSHGYNGMRYYLREIISRYRVDTSRVYGTGFSAGGGCMFETLGSGDSTVAKIFTAIAPINNAGVGAVNGLTAGQVENNLDNAKAYKVSVWTMTGEGDSFLSYDLRCHDSTNRLSPVPANKFTVYQGIGHACTRQYDTASRPRISYYGNTGTCNNGCNNGGVPVAPNNTGSPVRGTGITQDSLNLYEWFLTKQRSFPNTPAPDAEAGPDQVITLPTNSITLDGSGSSGGTGGTITSITWTKQSGAAATIASPSSAITSVTGLVAGFYIFNLRVVNNIGVVNTESIQVTVISNVAYDRPALTLVTNPTQDITTTSTTLTMSYTLNGSALKQIKWSKVKVPGQTATTFGIIGSSTASGTGATHADSSAMGRIANFLSVTGTGSIISNLAYPGYSVWAGRKNSTPSDSHDPVDPTRNVNASISTGAEVIVIAYPSNDYDGKSVQEAIAAYKNITDEIAAYGRKAIVATTQPREEFLTAGRLRLHEISDSLIAAYPTNSVNTFNGMVDYDRQTRLYPYNLDLIHINNKGHHVWADNFISLNPLSHKAISSSVIVSPDSLSTSVTGLTDGTHIFLGMIEDAHGQSRYVLTTVNVTTLGNTSPVANAGNDREITLPVAQVTVNGSGSSDPDGTIVTYAWTKISGPGTYTIVSESAASTVINNLVEGTYVFRLTVTDDDGATHTDDMTVTVNAAIVAPTCTGIRYEASPAGDGGYLNVHPLGGGDTLDLNNYQYTYVAIINRNGLPECPFVVINSGGVAKLKYNQMEIDNCTYGIITGSGSGDAYGIKIQPLGEDTIGSSAFGLNIHGRSKNITVTRVQIQNSGQGMSIKEDPSCADSLNYPNWVMDSIFIYGNRITNCWNQGIYAGNTSPDNAIDSYSPRPVVCGLDTVYPRPMRLGNIHIYNNYIDSTGRGGIQLSSASKDRSYIYNNTVKHSGMGGDEAQGNGIVVGSYTRVAIYNNTVINTYSHGIASEGGSGDQNIEIYDNYIDSSGYLDTWNLVNDTQYIRKISTQTIYPNSLDYPYNCFLKTIVNYDNETSAYTITGNTLGIHKKTWNIGFLDQNTNMRTTGTIVCGNVNIAGGSVTTNQEGSTSITIGSNCISVFPPRFKLKGRRIIKY